MTIEQLKTLSRKELLELAKTNDFPVRSNAIKAEIVISLHNYFQAPKRWQDIINS